MSVWEALLLGLIQGATEFLPVSSSGHLVISQALLGIQEGGILIEISLHVATLLAVVIYFRSRLLWIVSNLGREGGEGQGARRYALWLTIGTVPAVLAGLLGKDIVERLFDSPRVALSGLLATGFILISTHRARSTGRRADGPAGLGMGFAQALAIVPGISRSGSTIAAGMWLGVEKRDAAEFSFLLSIPAIAGAAVLQGFELAQIGASGPSLFSLPMAVGFVAAFLSGFAAIAGLLEVLRRRGLVPFAWYCWVVGLAGLIML